jgi:hypothetical protein
MDQAMAHAIEQANVKLEANAKAMVSLDARAGGVARSVEEIRAKALALMIGPDTPMPLEMAARAAFPDGAMTVSGLRNEIRKGNLEASKVAGRIWTTLNNIKRMMERCSIFGAGDGARERNSICANPNDRAAQGDGSYSTPRQADDASSKAQAHLSQIAQRLRKPSRPTLPKSTSPTSGKVVPIKS